MIARVEGDGPVAIDDMLDADAAHMVEPPLFLPLAARCFGLMAQSIPAEAAAAFRQRMAERLAARRCGARAPLSALAPGAASRCCARATR